MKQTKPMTKTEILKHMAENTGFQKPQLANFFEVFADLASSQLSKKGIGAFTIPELGVKLVLVVKPATKERQGRNPATQEPMTIKAKPKRKVLKARIMKKLKERVIGV